MKTYHFTLATTPTTPWRPDMNPHYYLTCTGQLEMNRAGHSDHTFASGNARQRRRKIRRLKAQGWTVYSLLRVADDAITTRKR